MNDGLTDAEERIVDLVSYGLTDGQIATRLHVTQNTVKTHLKRISERLGGTGRAFVVGECFRRGWLPLNDPGAPPPSSRQQQHQPRGSGNQKAAARRDQAALSAAGLQGERTVEEWVAHPYALDDLMRVLGGTSLGTIRYEREEHRRHSA